MNIIEKLIDAKIVDNSFHAAGMLNVLECVTLENDEQRLERCRLYIAWKKYYGNSKDFTSQTKAKAQARKNAIAGLPVPELPMLEFSSDEFMLEQTQIAFDDGLLDEALK